MKLPDDGQCPPVVPIQRRSNGCLVPLTFDQMNHWIYVEQQKEPLSVRLRAAATRISGPLDVGALKESIDRVVERHESLRTRVVRVDGRPYQNVDAPNHRLYLLETENAFTAQHDENSTQGYAEAFFQQKIDLSVGPLFGAKLLQLTTIEHVLLLALDHIVGDGVSNAILSREIWTTYGQAVRGQPFLLPHLPVQFADYALWWHQMRNAERIQHEAYWGTRLSGAKRIEVPLDLPGGCVEDDQSGQLMHYPLGKALSDQLRALGQREHILLPAIVLTAYAAAMSRWCHVDDFVLGFVSHGRHGRPELENMIGCLGRTTYLRISISGSETLHELLKLTHHELLSALRHEDFVPTLRPEEATDLLFSWGGLAAHSGRWSARVKQTEIPEIGLRPFPTRSRWPHKLLTFFSDTPASIVVTVSYRSDLLKQDSIARFGSDLQRFAQGLVHDPDAPLVSFQLR